MDKLLNKIQKELDVPKNQLNSFGGYKYRSCEDILSAVKPLLGEAVLTISDEMVQVGERYYVKATATLSLGEKKIEATAFAREAETKKGMDDAQITGAASSYARKYALNGLFAIDDEKDPDAQEPAKTAKSAPKQDVPPQVQVEAQGGTPQCPTCGKATIANGYKTKPTQPDFVCRDKSCVNDKGYRSGIWLPDEDKAPF